MSISVLQLIHQPFCLGMLRDGRARVRFPKRASLCQTDKTQTITKKTIYIYIYIATPYIYISIYCKQMSRRSHS